MFYPERFPKSGINVFPGILATPSSYLHINVPITSGEGPTTDHKYTETLTVSWTSFVIHKVNR